MQPELGDSAGFSSARTGLLYRVSVFLGAFLLFALEPLIVKMALPLYGGSAAVWSAGYLFFTLALLCGYLYAHILARRPLWQQISIHGALLAVAVIDLPIRVPPRMAPCSGCSPSLSLLVLLTERIGLPFLVLSATSPLLQSWWARHSGQSQESYGLFAFSNLGSIAALIAYPFAAEPLLRLSVQARTWTGGYVVFALIQLGIAVMMLLQTKKPTAAAMAQSPAALAEHSGSGLSANRASGGHRISERATARRKNREKKVEASNGNGMAPTTLRSRMEWTVISALQVVLLLALTNHLSMEIAPIPFIWTLPLALYLLAFVFVFSGLRRVQAQAFIRVVPFVLLPVVVLLALHERVALLPYIAMHLAAYFLLIAGLTARLAASRPPATELTEFYVWIAAGGALGGAATVFLAPHFFTTIAEYPIAIVFACLLLPSTAAGPTNWRGWVFEIGGGAILALGPLLMMRWAPLEGANLAVTQVLWFAVAAGFALPFFRHRVCFSVAVAVLLLVAGILPNENGEPLLLERNFFGPKRVMIDPDHRFQFLLSGETVHGLQALDRSAAGEPAAYYSRSGPLGDIFRAGGTRFAEREIGVVGMGIGSAGCYRQPGQHWKFFEIDPAVVAIARDQELFSLLDTCVPDAVIIIGDGRLQLSQDTSPGYALLILDAYSSDQVPVHLVTREALALYLGKLANDGILAFHISNRHFDLAPVLSALAADARLSVLERDDLGLSPEDVQAGKMVSRWVVMARQGQMPEGLVGDARWRPPASDPSLPVWTDDYSSLLRVLHL